MSVDMELRRELARQGFALGTMKNLEQQPKATYYKADGTPLPNLPADPRSMKRYLARGFTLAPPCSAVVPGLLTCDICGKVCKARIGLIAHRRLHRQKE